MRNEGFKLKTIAKRFGVSEKTIQNVLDEKTFRHVPRPPLRTSSELRAIHPQLRG
jgi:hypothetical protein